MSRGPNPWRPPDWSSVGHDGRSGNRFDDSDGYFRVLYASSSPLGCFIETLARFRKPPNDAITRALSQIENAADDYTPSGTVPTSWLRRRSIGSALVPDHCRFADIYSSEWLSSLRRHLEHEAQRQGLLLPHDASFDLSLLLSQHRSLTQRAATLVYELGFDGVVYASRHGSELENWALFEPFSLTDIEIADLALSDEALQSALDRLDLVIDRARTYGDEMP